MATEKIVNYTAAATAKIVADYKAAPTKATVEALAAEFGKTAKSIVAKLVREGVYTKAAEARASGVKARTKAETVAKIATLVGAAAKDLESLEKATAPALNKVLAALEASASGAESDEG